MTSPSLQWYILSTVCSCCGKLTYLCICLIAVSYCVQYTKYWLQLVSQSVSVGEAVKQFSRVVFFTQPAI